MEVKLMIIVTGTSATGKTVLSRKLADKLKIPVVNKDQLKELLFDNIGIQDEKWAMKLGIASFQLSYIFAEKLCETGKAFIIEGNFEDKYASEIFSSFKIKYNYKILQIYCYADAETLYCRYIKRDESGERHKGHIIPISSFEQFKNRVIEKNFKLNIVDCIDIELDTTSFNKINLEEIYKKIQEEIS